MMTDVMKAARIFDYGGPEVLRYGNYPVPECGPRDVLVRVMASSISGFDLKYRRGGMAKIQLPGRKRFPMPMQLGRDAAGIVERVGGDVASFKAGDRVIGLTSPANPLSRLTMIGRGNLSTDIDLPGHTMFGSNAQFVSRPESYWLPLPDGIGMAEAAAAMWAYGTSYRALCDRLKVRFGDTLLIIGATGGMGSATLDLARAMGVRPVVTTRSADKVGFLRDRGAAMVILLDGTDTDNERIRGGAGMLGIDAAIDFSGDERMIRLCVDALRPGGSMAIVSGELGDDPLPITARDCIRLELSVHGVRGSNLADQQAVVRLLAQGEIAPAVAKVMPLAEVAEAHRALEAGEIEGRIVLSPWE